MKRIIAIIVLLSTLIGCCACQPTPDTPPVVSKNDGTLEKSIVEGADDRYVYEPPKTVSCKAEVCNGHIVLQAENCPVTAQEGIKYPVYEAKTKDFDRETVLAVYKYCFGDAELTFHSTTRTKAEIDAQILEWKRMIFEIESGEYNPEDYFIGEQDETGHIITEQDAIDKLNAAIERLEKEKKSAPETIDRTPIKLSEYVTGDVINGDVSLGNGRCGRFYVSRDCIAVNFDYDSKDPEKNFIAVDSRYEEKGAVMPVYNLLFDDEHIKDAKENGYTEPNFPVEDAKSAAAEFVKSMGLEGTYYLSDVGQSSHYMPNCYAIVFMRKEGDAYLAADDAVARYGFANGQDNATGTAYAKPYYYEQLVLWVNRSGVRSFFYHAPLEITRTLADSVEINDDFEKGALGIANKMMKDYFTCATDEDGNELSYDEMYEHWANGNYYEFFTFSSIELFYAQIREQDKEGYFLLVPAWFISYRYISTLNGETDQEFLGYPREFAVNAVDGTVIDRTGMGY